MNPEAVYQLLVDANPVPAPDERGDRSMSDLRDHLGSEPMYTLETETVHPAADPNDRRPRRFVALAAAAAAIIAIGALVLAVTARDTADPEPVPADQVAPPPPSRTDRAIATASAFYQAVHAGDVATVLAMSNEQYTDPVADEQMWEMNATLIENGESRTIRSCEPLDVVELFVEVGCTVTTDEPVWNELGTTEYVAPVRVFDDQSTQWLPIIDSPFAGPNRAYAEYVQAYLPEMYDAVCDPLVYEPGTVVQDGGLALTAECAEVWAPIGDDVARWIAEGRPMP